MSELETILRNLRGEMARRGKTNKDLAKATGRSPGNVSNQLNGSAKITITDLDQIADLFDLSLYQLLLLLLQPIDSIKQVKQ